ncbi:hypothetical protein GC177_07745 [bacterium]|nr:hypothetical protein [bacterium]
MASGTTTLVHFFGLRQDESVYSVQEQTIAESYAHFRRFLHDYLPESPLPQTWEEFLTILQNTAQDHLPPDCFLNVNLNNTVLSLDVMFNGGRTHAQPVQSVGYEPLNENWLAPLEGRSFPPGETNIPPAIRGNGLGKGLMHFRAMLAARLGHDSLTIMCERDGKSLWSSMGFVPTEDTWEESIKPAIRRVLCTHGSELSPCSRDMFHSMLESADPHWITLLKSIQDPICVATSDGSVKQIPAGKWVLMDSGKDPTLMKDRYLKGKISLDGLHAADEVPFESAYPAQLMLNSVLQEECATRHYMRDAPILCQLAEQLIPDIGLCQQYQALVTTAEVGTIPAWHL